MNFRHLRATYGPCMMRPTVSARCQYTQATHGCSTHSYNYYIQLSRICLETHLHWNSYSCTRRHLETQDCPHQHDSTTSSLLGEVKHVRAWLVLWWGTVGISSLASKLLGSQATTRRRLQNQSVSLSHNKATFKVGPSPLIQTNAQVDFPTAATRIFDFVVTL